MLGSSTKTAPQKRTANAGPATAHHRSFDVRMVRHLSKARSVAPTDPLEKNFAELFPCDCEQELALRPTGPYWWGRRQMSAISDKYRQLGGPSGFLGQPTGSEKVTPDGRGRYHHYEH